MRPPRNRIIHATAILTVIAAGLASRRWPVWPDLLGKYPGDALWAVMVYLGWGFVFPTASCGRIAVLAAGTCVVVEFLKLWSAPWLVELRQTTAGHLVFGHAFSWQNLVAYGVGILAAFLVERAVSSRQLNGT